MRKYIFIICVTLFVVACSTNKKSEQASEKEIPVIDDKGLVTHKFKIDGLQDSIISDSIWRIIFQVEGIDKLVLSKDDSMAVFTVDPEQITKVQLKKEIIDRGGKLID